MRAPRLIIPALLLLASACSTEPGSSAPGPDHPDAAAPEVPGATPAAKPWRIHWFELESCPLYGDNAQVHVYVDIIDAQPVDPPRHLQAPCTAGEIKTSDLGTGPVIHAMYEVEGPASGQRSSRSAVQQDVHDTHDLYFHVPPPR